MKTTTFIQPLLRQRYISFIFCLLALLGSLGAAPAAYGQTAITANTLTLNVRGTAATYNTRSTTAGAGVFAGTNFGTFNASTQVFALNGATLTLNDPTGNYNDGQLLYRLYPTGGATGSFTSVTLGAGALSGGVRTFTLTGLTTNLLVGLTNTGYSFDVVFRANDNNTFAPSVTDTPIKTATFTVTGVPTPAPTLTPGNIQLAADGGPATSYFFPNTGTTPQFPGNSFASSANAGGTPGAFDINNGQLRLLNTTVTTTEAGANTITGVILYYRTRAAGNSGGAFQPIILTQSGATGGTRTFGIDPASTANALAQPNLIATPAVTTTGSYVVEVYYQASGTNSSTGNFTLTYPPTGYLSATFQVGGTPIALTIWTGAINDNWFDSGNWTNGIPNSTTNALVRDLGTGSNVPYPNIRSDYRYTTAGGALLYDNTGSGPAQALNLTVGGTSSTGRAAARLAQGQLRVFGTFDNTYDGFVQSENTIMEFAGGNQPITGGSFTRVDISGGGTKALQGLMNVAESLNFLTPNVYTTAGNPLATNPYTTLATSAGILTTDITQPATNLVVLADRAATNANNGAQLNGENDQSFLYGLVQTSRASVTFNSAHTYGNMGLGLTFTGTNNPTTVAVTRNTVESYTPSPGKFSIRRSFKVVPANPATSSGGLAATVQFRYRNVETKRLNGPSTSIYGTQRIAEQNLTLFVSANSGSSFSQLGRDAGSPDTVNNTVTRTGVRQLATFTLGDTNNPLGSDPLAVSLVAFSAVRTNRNATVSWTTATEEDNKGFNVQVSTNGVAYRTLAFVTSQRVNSQQPLAYEYTDTETAKTGTRYYRLEQLDLSGKVSYSPVRAVRFDAADAAELTLSAAPNPFLTGTTLVLEGTASTGPAHVQVTDLLGRVVLDQQAALTGPRLTLTSLGSLRSGTYLAKVTLLDGITRTVRIQKQ